MSDLPDMCRREATCLLLGVFSAMAWPRTARAFEPMPDGFRDEVLAIGRRRYPNSVPPLNPGPGDADLIWGDHHLYLYNLYAGVHALPPAQREKAILAWLDRFDPESQAKMEAARKATDDWNTAKPLLRPKFQPAAFASSYKRLVQQPFSPGLAIAYAFDLGKTDLYVMREKLATWSVPIAEVHAAAIDNLERMSAGISLEQPKHPKDVGSLVEVSTGDGYDASRILLPVFRARLLEAMGPSLRAGVPGRDVLYVWSPDFGRHYGIEDEVRRQAGEISHPLSSEIFAFDAKGVRLADGDGR